MIYGEMAEGDLIRVGRSVYRVSKIVHPKEVPGVEVPTGWDDHYRDRAVVVEGVAIATNTSMRVVLPGVKPPLRADYEILARRDDEEHYPRCGSCHDVWPCAEILQIRDGRRMADRVEASLKVTTNTPCECECGRRFKTMRGLKQHRARSWRHR